MFYVIFDPETPSDSFWITDYDGYAKGFETESEAADAAKEYSCISLVLKPVAGVTQRTTYKVEKIK